MSDTRASTSLTVQGPPSPQGNRDSPPLFTPPAPPLSHLLDDLLHLHRVVADGLQLVSLPLLDLRSRGWEGQRVGGEDGEHH